MMENKMNKSLVLLLAAPLWLACSVHRHAAPSAEPQRVETQQQDLTRNRYSLLANQVPEPVSSIFPDITFNSLEYEHVRVRGMNPLPDGGLRIDLDKLSGEFAYPLGGKLISDYGMRNGRPHTGIDLKAARGDTIRAILPGVVRMAKLYSSYGNIVVIRHYNGLESVYSHNSANLVSPNDVVLSGQPVALAGRTGRATTEHLHFEVRAAGEPIDPKLLVDPAAMSIRRGWLLVNNKNGRVIAASSPVDIDQIAAATENDLAATNAARADALAQSEGRIVAKATSETVYYTIKRGDVLGSIAKKYGTTVSRLCALNNLKSPDKINEGQRLKIR